MDLVKVLEHLRPEATWELLGDTYDGITWHDEIQLKPTLEECENAWASLKIVLDQENVKELRRRLYSETSDLIYFKWRRGEATEEDWLTSVALVRETYPYKEEVDL